LLTRLSVEIRGVVCMTLHLTVEWLTLPGWYWRSPVILRPGRLERCCPERCSW
jgi:hypothetical protein